MINSCRSRSALRSKAAGLAARAEQVEAPIGQWRERGAVEKAECAPKWEAMLV